MTLYNLSGDTAAAAVDPPTAEEARAAGMTLPEAGEGEALYLGAADVSQARALYVAFVLSEDGSEIRNLTVTLLDMDLTYRQGTLSHTAVSMLNTAYNGSLAVGESIEVTDARIRRFAVDGDGAEGLLEYRYSDGEKNLEYPFDPAWVRFARVG